MKVLVLTLSFGSGHVRAAQAVAREVSRCEPCAEVRVVDALADCRWLFRAGYVWPYWAMVRYAPALWNRFFAARLARLDQHTAPEWAFRRGCPRVFEMIAEFEPDVIITVEVAACEMADIAMREGLTKARVINVITDYEAEPVWVKPLMDAYVVADEDVRDQLKSWGAPSERIFICGIPTDQTFRAKHDDAATRASYGLSDDAPVVLLMGGGMGPTRMDEVAARLCESGEPLQVVAVAGQDARVRRRLLRLRAAAPASLRVLGWIEDVAALMHTASVLVTKPGGLTTAEAALCALPVVMFDAIPGPELRNAARFARAGAGIMTDGAKETASAALSLLRDEHLRRRMSASAARLARPDAATEIARLALCNPSTLQRSGKEDDGLKTEREQGRAQSEHDASGNKQDAPGDHPVLILTISNGAGHIRVAQGLASALRLRQPSVPVLIADVADYMTPLARFTHIRAYLWLVKHAPAVWDRIDRYQKRQTQTSPEWFYRRGCRELFELARRVRPRALIATEVGCCEIAALIKRDLALDAPLIAANDDFDADRAWVQPEVDLYCFVTEQCGDELVRHGAARERVAIWGPSLTNGFDVPRKREEERAEVCRWLELDQQKPLVLVAGGGEGMGRIEEVTGRLLRLKPHAPQLVVLAGHNERLKSRCERLARDGDVERLRVLGWTGPEQMPKLMHAADLMVSKLGSMFNEAIASELPIVALEPPPGAERVQYQLLEEWRVGRAVRHMDELIETVADLLSDTQKLSLMREQARARRKTDAARRIACWLEQALSQRRTTNDDLQSAPKLASRLRADAQAL
ncbi:MAG TPA: glycosyltransferase [Pyrinomonadaceae bacterium]|jgi:processive 1,2-diacylglycerol beta-glucosyltransferase|nr:glycosyltransferase [Pyrinomonadaceae bacterium]